MGAPSRNPSDTSRRTLPPNAPLSTKRLLILHISAVCKPSCRRRRNARKTEQARGSAAMSRHHQSAHAEAQAQALQFTRRIARRRAAISVARNRLVAAFIYVEA